MYTLQLTDGTLIEGLNRLNSSTFEINSEKSLNHELTDNNLSLAILLDEDGLVTDIFLNYTLQSFFFQNNIFHFRIAEIKELERQERHRLEKSKRKYSEERKKWKI